MTGVPRGPPAPTSAPAQCFATVRVSAPTRRRCREGRSSLLSGAGCRCCPLCACLNVSTVKHAVIEHYAQHRCTCLNLLPDRRTLEQNLATAPELQKSAESAQSTEQTHVA